MTEPNSKSPVSNSSTTSVPFTQEEMKLRLDRFSEVARLTPPSQCFNTNLHTAISLNAETIKPYNFKPTHGLVYDIRYGSLPVQLLSTCFVQCQFDTYRYTYDLGHAFVPVYMQS